MVPRALFFQGRLVGALSSYGYETPWAVARLEPADPDLYRRLLGVCEMHTEVEAWPETSREEDEARWLDANRRHGISEADHDDFNRGPWAVRTVDGADHEIWLPTLDRDGFVTWRW
jgi:hypothetical protein